jgi:hypothetical protein
MIPQGMKYPYKTLDLLVALPPSRGGRDGRLLGTVIDDAIDDDGADVKDDEDLGVADELGRGCANDRCCCCC